MANSKKKVSAEEKEKQELSPDSETKGSLSKSPSKKEKKPKASRRKRKDIDLSLSTDDTLVGKKAVEEVTEYELNIRSMQEALANDESVTGFKLLLGYLGIFLMMIGALSLVSLVVLIDPTLGQHFYGTEGFVETSWLTQAYYWYTVFIPGMGAILLGGALYFVFLHKKKQGKLQGMEDIFLILLVWILAILIFALPFVLVPEDCETNKIIGYSPYNFTQAIFEIISGLSTTGLSVMSTDTLPRILVFHRALANFVGGVGLVLIVASVISSHSGSTMYSLEGHNDQLLANMKKSARMIFLIYSGITLLSAIALLIAGCSPMDAFCFSMACVATGGLASHSESVFFFESLAFPGNGLAVEIILFIEMCLGGTNFLIHYSILKLKPKKAFLHFEFFVCMFELVLVYPFMVVGLFQTFDKFSLQYDLASMVDSQGIALYSVPRTLFRAAFELVSCMTTTGFCTFDPSIFGIRLVENGEVIASSGYIQAYGTLATMSFIPLIIVMLSGAQSGSTTGGMKQNRVGLFFLNIKWSADKMVDRQEVTKAHHIYKFGEKVVVSDDDVKDASNYIGLYFAVMMIIILAQSCFKPTNVSAIDSLGNAYEPFSVGNNIFEAITYLSCIGSSSGFVGYANSQGMWGILWIGSIGMFIGRLEITIFVLTLKKGLRLLWTRKNNFATHMRHEKNRLNAVERVKYKAEMRRQKEEMKAMKAQEKALAQNDAEMALKTMDAIDLEKQQANQDPSAQP